MNEPWKIALLGRLRLEGEGETITRFRTQKTAALLGYLACFNRRTHPREELIERFWPGDDLEAGRASLRTAIASLRRQLEPPGIESGSIFIADRTNVRLNPAAIRVDTDQFAEAIRSVFDGCEEADARRADRLESALALYAGELLPGFYDEWVLTERNRLSLLRIQALRELTHLCEALRDERRALMYAQQAAAADPLEESSQLRLLQLLVTSGETALAIRHYREWEQLLDTELGEETPQAARALLESIRVDADRSTVAIHGRSTRRSASGSEGMPPLVAAENPSQNALPARRAPATPHLPLLFTRFFGRDTELAWLDNTLRLPGIRLVTLTGPGGTGKTRLAIEAARLKEGLFGDAIWFVPLADADDLRYVPGALLKALQITPAPQGNPMEQVVAALKDRPALLVLDNFEQLAEQGASFVRDLLMRAPSVVCLITSRQSLGVPGEREYPVAPLPVPVYPGTPERLMEFASIQMFADRAQAVRPDFAVTTRNADIVAQLCERLEGIPLAIELAAAQIRVMTPGQMLSQLEDRFAFLVSHRRDLPERHRALRAAIEWSYAMLPGELKQLFMALSVFRGGWTVAAAAAVSAIPDPATLIYHLSNLCTRSLVLSDDADGEYSATEMRYRMLETLREFAAEQLSPEDYVALTARHRAYYVTFVEASEASLRSGNGQQETLDRLETEHDNLRAALASAQSGLTRDGAAGLRLCGVLWRFWWLRGYPAEGREHLRVCLDMAGPEDSAERARVLNGAANLAHAQGDLSAATTLQEQAVALWRRLGDARGIAGSLTNLGSIRLGQGEYEAAHILFMEGLARWRDIGDMPGELVALTGVGNVAYLSGDAEGARPHYEETLRLFRTQGDTRGIAWMLHNLGNVASDLGELDTAQSFYEEALVVKRQINDRWGTASTLHCLGNVASERGLYSAARSIYEEAIAIHREMGDRSGEALLLLGIGNTYLSEEDTWTSAPLYRDALKIGQEQQDIQVISTALSSVARFAERNADGEHAVRLWSAYAALRARSGMRLPPVKQAKADTAIAALQAAMEECRFVVAWAAGQSFDVDRAIEDALGALPDG